MFLMFATRSWRWVKGFTKDTLRHARSLIAYTPLAWSIASRLLRKSSLLWIAHSPLAQLARHCVRKHRSEFINQIS